MNGKLLQRSISRLFPTKTVASLIEILILCSIGFLAIAIRTHVRFPMGISGRHGLIVMVFFMMGRAMSERKAVSLYTAIGASLFVMVSSVGIKHPHMLFIYILVGLVIDVCVFYSTKLNIKSKLLLYSLIGGIAYMIIPLSRIVIHIFTGYPFPEFLKHGYIVPIVLHFVFGATGSLLGSGLVQSIKTKK